MPQRPEITNRSYAVRHPYACDVEEKVGYVSEIVATKHGYVRAYSQYGEGKGDDRTYLSIILGGVQPGGVRYERTIRRYYRPRALVTVANRFAADAAFGRIEPKDGRS